MWSFRSALLFVLAAALVGCGFRPLYAPPAEDTTGSGRYAFDVLERVEIANIQDREGQFLRNRLQQLLHPSGAGKAKDYVLTVSLSESTRNALVQRSAVATRANLIVTGQYTLTPLREDGLRFSDATEVTSGYNIFRSEYQTLAAEQGARERALEELAQQIRLRVATFLTNPIQESSRP